MILNIIIRRFHHRTIDQNNIFQTVEDGISFNETNYKCIKICRHIMFELN